jgi:hypothetical protein
LLSGCALLMAGCQHRTPQPPAAVLPQPQPASVGPPAAAPQPPAAPAPRLAAPPQIDSAQQLPLPPVAPRNLSNAEMKLDAALLTLARAARSQDPSAAAREMATAKLEQKDRKVKVEIVATDKKSVPEMKLRIAQLGGEITAELENHIWAYVPPAAIDDLSHMDTVWSMASTRATNTAQ